MESLNPNIDSSKLGACILEYADTDAGKTMSALTLEDPIAFINTQAKDPRVNHLQVKHGKAIKYFKPKDSFDDIMEDMNGWLERFRKGDILFKSLFFDDLTFGQANIRHDLEDDRHSARKLSEEEKTEIRGLTDRFRFEKPDWGSMGSMMSRLTYLFNQFSQYGVVVVATAVARHDYPKYGGGVKTAPSLVGMDYPQLLHGYFDFIGYVVEPFKLDEEMNPVLPRISFHSEDESFMARCNSLRLLQMNKQKPAPLDFTKIMKVVRGG